MAILHGTDSIETLYERSQVFQEMEQLELEWYIRVLCADRIICCFCHGTGKLCEPLVDVMWPCVYCKGHGYYLADLPWGS